MRSNVGADCENLALPAGHRYLNSHWIYVLFDRSGHDAQVLADRM